MRGESVGLTGLWRSPGSGLSTQSPSAAPRGDTLAADTQPARALRTGICRLNLRETRTSYSQLLLRDSGFLFRSGSSQNLGFPESM